MHKACIVACINPGCLFHLDTLVWWFQDTDSGVRDASIEALVALSHALAEQTHSVLAGSGANPVLRVIFDCLAEQKKESQSAAGQALLQVRK